MRTIIVFTNYDHTWSTPGQSTATTTRIPSLPTRKNEMADTEPGVSAGNNKHNVSYIYIFPSIAATFQIMSKELHLSPTTFSTSHVQIV